MEKIEQKIGKKIVTFEEGEEVGFVLDICFDEKLKQFLGFVVCDEESEQEMFLSKQKVKAESDNVIFIEKISDTEINFLSSNNPIGKKVFDKKGTDLGTVKSVITEGKWVDKLISEKCEIKQKYIFSSGKYIIFSKNKKRIKNTLKNHQKNLPKIEIMSIKNNFLPRPTLPTRLFVSPSQLLNRTATKDIFGLNNELIIREGEIITQNKIEKAKKHNKIGFLLFNSR